MNIIIPILSFNFQTEENALYSQRVHILEEETPNFSDPSIILLNDLIIKMTDIRQILIDRIKRRLPEDLILMVDMMNFDNYFALIHQRGHVIYVYTQQFYEQVSSKQKFYKFPIRVDWNQMISRKGNYSIQIFNNTIDQIYSQQCYCPECSDHDTGILMNESSYWFKITEDKVIVVSQDGWMTYQIINFHRLYYVNRDLCRVVDEIDGYINVSYLSDYINFNGSHTDGRKIDLVFKFIHNLMDENGWFNINYLPSIDLAYKQVPNESRMIRYDPIDGKFVFDDISEVKEYVFISHIWEQPNNPDPYNLSLYFVLFQPNVSFWLDYVSLPQKHLIDDFNPFNNTFKKELNRMFLIQSNAVKSIKILPKWGHEEYNHRGWCIAEQALIGSSPMLDLLYKYKQVYGFTESLKRLRIHLSNMDDADAIQSYFGLKGGSVPFTTFKYSHINKDFKLISGYKSNRHGPLLSHLSLHRVSLEDKDIIIIDANYKITLHRGGHETIIANRKRPHDKLNWLTIKNFKEILSQHATEIREFFSVRTIKKSRVKMKFDKMNRLSKNIMKGIQIGLFTKYGKTPTSMIPVRYLVLMVWTRKSEFGFRIIRDILQL